MLHTPLSVAASFLPLVNASVHTDCALIMVSVTLLLLMIATTYMLVHNMYN